MAFDSLDLPHANSVLLKLLEGKVLKTKLQSIVKNLYSLNTLLKALQEDGLIYIDTQSFGKNIQYISLTPKGEDLAETFKNAQEEKEGDFNLKLTEEEAEKARRATMLFHYNVMDDHITLKENTAGKNKRIFNIYIKRNGNGDFRLWCEEDDSFDCWHVRAGWGYPEVQHMMVNYKGKTKICPFCNTVNDIDADYCKRCGAKLE